MLTVDELRHYQAYLSIEPYSRGFAMLATVVANVNRGKRGRRAKLEDFMPRRPKSTEEIIAGFRQFASNAA